MTRGFLYVGVGRGPRKTQGSVDIIILSGRKSTNLENSQNFLLPVLPVSYNIGCQSVWREQSGNGNFCSWSHRATVYCQPISSKPARLFVGINEG